MPVWRVPVCPTFRPVAVVEASVVAPVTATVLPNVAASSALNVPAVVMFVLIVVTAPTSVAPSVIPPRTERTEKTIGRIVLLINVMCNIK